MSTPIIGGGDDARRAIAALEAASLNVADKTWRDNAELLLKDFADQCTELAGEA